jgi:alkylhydroperoxidase family enzyme
MERRLAQLHQEVVEVRIPEGQISKEEQDERTREGTEADSLQRTFAHAPEVAYRQRQYLRAVTSGLEPRLRELAILGITRQLSNSYCWTAHLEPAMTLGLTGAQLRALRDGDDSAYDAADREVLAYVRAVDDQTVTDAQHASLRGRFGNEVLVKLTVLVGLYGLISRFSHAMDVPAAEAAPPGLELP